MHWQSRRASGTRLIVTQGSVIQYNARPSTNDVETTSMYPPQRILHLLADPGNFDQSSQLEYLVEHQVAGGNQVRVVLLAEECTVRQSLAARGATTRLIRRRWKFDPFAGRIWASELKTWQPTVVHHWGTAAMQLASVTRIVSRAELLLATLTRSPHAGDWITRKQISAIDTFIVDTQHMAREYAAWGIAEQQICVIRPGIDLVDRTKPPLRANLLEKLRLPAESRLIAVGGPLTRAQSIDEAIWCYEMVRTLHEKACLLVLGDGPERANLERYARLVSEPQAIRFCKVSAELTALLRCCHVYWQTGAGESISAMMLSAMASGVPVVASDTPVMHEVLSDGDNGFLVPSGSRTALGRQTDRLLADSTLAKRLADAACRHVTERFGIEQLCSCYNAAYEQVPMEAYCSS